MAPTGAVLADGVDRDLAALVGGREEPLAARVEVDVGHAVGQRRLAELLQLAGGGVDRQLTTRNGCERSAAYSTRLSWLTTIGITVPPTASVCTGVSVPLSRSSASTEISWLSALDT
jgi:hypothetical protein